MFGTGNINVTFRMEVCNIFQIQKQLRQRRFCCRDFLLICGGRRIPIFNVRHGKRMVRRQYEICNNCDYIGCFTSSQMLDQKPATSTSMQLFPAFGDYDIFDFRVMPCLFTSELPVLLPVVPVVSATGIHGR